MFQENESSSPNPIVVIIGAGIAGLAAARTLLNTKSQKFDVILLEASDRIGGRICTKELGQHFVEFGAEWLHGTENNPIYDTLAKSSNLELLDLDGHENGAEEDKFWSTQEYIFATENGEIIQKSLNQAITKFLEMMEADTLKYAEVNKLCPKSIIGHKYYNEILFHEEEYVALAGLDWARRYLNSYDCADDWSEISYYGTTLEYIELPGITNISWKHPANFSTFLSLLMVEEPIPLHGVETPSWIKLNHEVKTISKNPSTEEGLPRISLKCSSGIQFDANHIICTIPLGVLKEKHQELFYPSLPLEMIKAINLLGYGTANKLYFEFENPWWNKDFKGVNFLWTDCEQSEIQECKDLMKEFNGIPLWCRNLLGFQIVDNHPNVLRSWISGAAARFLETQDNEYISSISMKVLRKFMTKVDIPDPIQFTMAKWFTNPFSRGTYSVCLVISEAEDVWAKDLAQPFLGADTKPILCFCGEATSQHFYSSTHGAYESGLREAKRIMECYINTTSY